MATYNLGVQEYVNGWTVTSNLEKAIEYFVTKDMYNYIDSHFKDKRPFLINEVGNKAVIAFLTGSGVGDSAILIEKTEHYIGSSKLNLKYIHNQMIYYGLLIQMYIVAVFGMLLKKLIKIRNLNYLALVIPNILLYKM